MSEYNENVPQQGDNVPGKGPAIGSLVCGIVAVVFWWFGFTAIVSVVLGIVGLILSANAKKAGFKGGMQTAGFVLSLIGLIGGAIAFVACVACTGGVACLGGLGSLDSLF
jgi:hypothetical protein